MLSHPMPDLEAGAVSLPEMNNILQSSDYRRAVGSVGGRQVTTVDSQSHTGHWILKRNSMLIV